ncbi:MAG: Archaeal ATPase [Candidatus Scalindua rubra]|uniref:Archaeal ATPase n=1 Tax=Candidatus Scalindua rubra TaxID=1872076 RepID=A0A1E3X5Z6_9BACT|nr:MAG: Archaeal ATPase [Candidatus Scalindua rubra]
MRNDTEKILYVLNEWFEGKLPWFIERSFPYEWVDSNLILVLAGVRRSGKTYLLYQIVDRLRKDISPQNIIYINLEDDRLYPITGNEIGDILTVYRRNFSVSKSHRVYLFLDEVQNIPNWERTLRRFYDREKGLKLIITGSSAHLLSSEIASSLRGRTLTYRVYPFSFREFLKTKGVSYGVERLRFSRKKDEVLRLFKEYMEYGGFPQVVCEKTRTDLLKEYYRSIMYRDIIERYSIRNIPLFENFLKLTVQNMSSLFSFGKVANVLKSIGYRVSKSTLIDYLRYIENAFLAFEVPVFSYSVKDHIQYPRKIYLIDTGLRNAVSFRFTEDRGRLAENIVFVELLRRFGEGIYYWKDHYGHEVDFVIKKGFQVDQIIQVCWSPDDEKTLKREVAALLKAMEEFKLSYGVVLTEDMYEDREIDNSRVEFRPLWLWLIS